MGLRAMRVLSDEIWFAQPQEKVFEFFSNAGNLDAITPAWLHFRILTPMPVEMCAGTLLNYRLKLKGIPIYWTTEICEWNPPNHFVDRQLKGPYRKWIHTHTFESKDGGTLVGDQVEYVVPGLFLEPLINRFLVRPDLQRIFQHRRLQLQKHFK